MKHVATLAAVSLSIALATAKAGPPELRPLLGGEERPRAAATNSPEPPPNQLYYYSNGQRIYLNDTGFAVAKPKQPNAVEKLGLRAVSAAPYDHPLASLMETITGAGLVIVNGGGADSPNVRAAADHPEQIEFVLPIVSIDLTRGPSEERAANTNTPTLLVMTPGIAARFKSDVDVSQFIGALGLKVLQKQGRVPNGYILTLAEGPITHERLILAANRLYEKGKDSGQVLYAHPDFLPAKKRQQIQIDDPRFTNQWHLSNSGASGGLADADVDALEAWAIGEGGPTIRIAIIDDSVQRNHVDLAGNYQTGRYYQGGFPPSETDDPTPKTGNERHGTCCAGVAVGVGNQIGIRGACPRCGLIGIHFWDASIAQTADAFYFANDPDGQPNTDDGAGVISCSWSWNAAFDATRVAVEDVASNGRNGRGVVVLFAAGNDNGSTGVHQHFCSLPSVVCVGATDWLDNRTYYSNFSGEVDVVAPSSGSWGSLRIDTTDNDDSLPHYAGGSFAGYALGDYSGTGDSGFGGTSSATPLTAGIAGLILSANPTLTAGEVRSILEHTTDRILGGTLAAAYDPTTGHDINYGFGRVNAKRAVHAARQAQNDPDAIWPERIRDLAANVTASGVRLTWRNPPRDVTGVLVVRSNTSLAWRPYDGERYGVGQAVPGQSATTTLSVNAVEQYDDSGIGAGTFHYAVFAFNGDHRYAWGQAITVTVQPQDLTVAHAD